MITFSGSCTKKTKLLKPHLEKLGCGIHVIEVGGNISVVKENGNVWFECSSADANVIVPSICRVILNGFTLKQDTAQRTRNGSMAVLKVIGKNKWILVIDGNVIGRGTTLQVLRMANKWK